MTTENNAAQAVQQDPLSDEYVNAVIQRHGYDSPETVIASLAQWIGRHGGENSVTLLMYEAHKALSALSKLRAPVAPAPDGFVPVAASVLRTLAEPGLIKRTLGKFSPALAGQLGFTPEEEKAIEAMYLAFGESFDYPCAAPASAPVALSGVERQAVTGLIAVARAAFTVCDDAEDTGVATVNVDRDDIAKLGEALDLLDELPDDQPGYSMGPSNRAEWALRRLLGVASAPVAGEAQPDDLNKRLLEATIRDLAAISEHLGLDPNEGGADPIIEAIDELRRERDDWVDAQYADAGDAAPQASPVAGGAAHEPLPGRFKPPFDNCSFRMCDLPGQCRGEGKCHHPVSAAPQAPAGWRWTLHPAGLHPDVYAAAAARDSAEPVVRYCPGCGRIGPVEGKYRDCCPDGNEARMIPVALAEKCRDTFRIAVKVLLADAAANDSGAPQASADTENCGLCGRKQLVNTAPTAAEGGQASEALRIVFPAHLRKMWSGGEVQAWLDEHQGVTAPKASAKGSLERYRKWQAERGEAFGAGVNAAADLVKKMVDAYDTDHGSTDPETGTREYPGEGATWVCEMQELEESIRALSAQPGAIRNSLIAEPSGNPGELGRAGDAPREDDMLTIAYLAGAQAEKERAAVLAGRRERAEDDLPAFMQSRMTPWGLLVQACRIVVGTTLMDMSRELGIRPSSLSSYEHGRKGLNDHFVIEVMRFFEDRGLCIPATSWRKAAIAATQAEQGERDAG
ncbi:hypothetical protein ACXXNA_05895 [Bordetella bronchiseptica]